MQVGLLKPHATHLLLFHHKLQQVGKAEDTPFRNNPISGWNHFTTKNFIAISVSISCFPCHVFLCQFFSHNLHHLTMGHWGNQKTQKEDLLFTSVTTVLNGAKLLLPLGVFWYTYIFWPAQHCQYLSPTLLLFLSWSTPWIPKHSDLHSSF